MLEKKLFNLFIEDKHSGEKYACVYHKDDSGVKLVFANKFTEDIIETFKNNDINIILKHLEKYGFEIESYRENSIEVLRDFVLPEKFNIYFLNV